MRSSPDTIIEVVAFAPKVIIIACLRQVVAPKTVFREEP